MRRPFRSRCFGTCHFCIKTSPHGYKLHAIVRKLQELKLRYSVISYLSYHSFNILDDLPKSDISYFLSITVPSAVRIRTLQSPSCNSIDLGFTPFLDSCQSSRPHEESRKKSTFFHFDESSEKLKKLEKFLDFFVRSEIQQ